MADQKQPPLLSRLSPPKGAVKSKRRLGRGVGSGLGKTAGMGMKGQHARGYGKVRRGFEGGQTPLFRRLPKVGFVNHWSKTVATVNVKALGKFDAGATVDPEALVKAGLLRSKFDAVKILGDGSLDKALTVRAHAFSEGAKALIEKAGGKAELIEQPAEAQA